MIEDPDPGRLLAADRIDLRWLLGLTFVAFVLRFFSPIFPDFFAHPFSAPPVSNCVHSTPVDAAGHLGTLCGLAYPYQKSYSGQPPNGQVFDEIYFATFAHDDLKEVQYFDPEPPLSKLIIAGGQVGWGWFRATFQGAHGSYADLGYNTFGWRIMSCLFGTLCVPMMYLLARQLWPASRFFAIAASVLVTFDGMFFIQSRIGMIDIFPIFFILASYFVYLIHARARGPAESLVTLLVLGTVLGLAVAAKWIALAAFASIVLLLAIQIYRRRSAPGGAPPAIYAWTALVALVAIPLAIYMVSWTPFFIRGQFNSWAFSLPHLLRAARTCTEPLNGANLWDYQLQAYCYHATLTATHPYGSPWWTWPLLLRPVAYYYQGAGLGVDQWSNRPLVAGMVNLGNPLIWWASLPALVVLPFIAIRKRSFVAAVIILGFVTQYLPWVRITRVVFLYHMFGGLTFMVLALAFVLAMLVEERWLPRPLAAWCLAMAAAVFLYLYPVWTAAPISDLAYLSGPPGATHQAGVPLWGGKMWIQINCSQPAHPKPSSWVPCWI